MIVVTVVLAGLWSEASGTTANAHPRARSTVTVSAHRGPGRWVEPSHRGPYSRPAWRRPRGRVYYPPRRPVIVPRPIIKPVVIAPLPPVVVRVPSVTVEPVKLTIWVTNSNGSRISVELIRDGLYYIGPRGEYYSSIPTNEQLRVVYGF